MGFFNRKRPEAQPTQVPTAQPVTPTKPKESSLMTIPDTEEVETYQDDSEEVSQNTAKSLQKQVEVEENSETDEDMQETEVYDDSINENSESLEETESDEELTPEEVELKERLAKIAADKKAKKEAELKAKLARTKTIDQSTEQPLVQQVPVYLTEGEFLREIMNRVQGLEQWAQELTLYLKTKEKL